MCNKHKFKKIFYIPFWYQVFESQCIFHTSGTFQFSSVTFQATVHMWPVATALGSAGLEGKRQITVVTMIYITSQNWFIL